MTCPPRCLFYLLRRRKRPGKSTGAVFNKKYLLIFLKALESIRENDLPSRDNALKKNCWEYMGCGQRSGRKRSQGCTQCPVPEMTNYDGINGGKNGGRICWLITGTLCDEDVQLTFAHKFDTCRKCDFYWTVREEAGKNICLPIEIIETICEDLKERKRSRRTKKQLTP